MSWKAQAVSAGFWPQTAGSETLVLRMARQPDEVPILCPDADIEAASSADCSRHKECRTLQSCDSPSPKVRRRAVLATVSLSVFAVIFFAGIAVSGRPMHRRATKAEHDLQAVGLDEFSSEASSVTELDSQSDVASTADLASMDAADASQVDASDPEVVEDATDALEDGATIAGSSQEVLPDDMQTSVSDIADPEVVGDATDTAELEGGSTDVGSSSEVLPGVMQTSVSDDADPEVIGDATDTAELEGGSSDVGSSSEVLPGGMQTWVSARPDSEVVGDATDTAEHEDATVDAGSSPEVLPGDMQTWVSGDSEAAFPHELHAGSSDEVSDVGSVPLDCTGRPEMWDSQKRGWCCGIPGIHCGSTVVVHHHVIVPYHCDAGYSHWSSAWSSAKQDFCCQHAGRGCQAYHCREGFETSYNTWSSSKRAYCCANFQMGCKVMNYDCSADLSHWQHKWTEHKKSWCCKTVGKGCPKTYSCTTSAVNKPSTWAQD
eukprot:s6015_g3.t1